MSYNSDVVKLGESSLMAMHVCMYVNLSYSFLVALLLKQSVTYLVCLACVCRMAYVETPPPPEMAFLLEIS